MALNEYQVSARRDRRSVFRNEEFHGETIRVDGNIYEGCIFINCKLEFGASALPTFRQCRFKDSDWFFADSAANMIVFLNELAQDFGEPGRELVERLFGQIMEERILPPSDMRPAVLVAEVSAGELKVTPLPATATTNQGPTPLTPNCPGKWAPIHDSPRRLCPVGT